jgi:hypothetical protein
MQVTNILILVAALAAAGVSCADIFRTTSNNCGGSRVGCKDIQGGRCCKFSRPVRQVQFTLPANSRGFAYPDDDCEGSSTFFRTSAKGTFCRRYDSNSKPFILSPPLALCFILFPTQACEDLIGQANVTPPRRLVVNSAKWQSGLSSKDSAVLRAEDAGVTSPCSEPDHASFVRDDGTHRAVRIPQGMSVKVEEWLEEGMLDLMDQLEDY